MMTIKEFKNKYRPMLTAECLRLILQDIKWSDLGMSRSIFSPEDDTYDIFRQLHKCIITECSIKLEKIGLLNIFNLTPVNISDKTINSFFSQDIL